MNAYIRFKLALTEEAPSIRPYDENGWAALADVDAVPLETPLRLLEALPRALGGASASPD